MAAIGTRALYVGSVQTVSGAASAGFQNIYNPVSTALTSTLPLLSGLAVGARVAVQKYSGATTLYPVLISTQTGDTFFDGSAVTVLRDPGEQRLFEVAVDSGGVRRWKSPDSHNANVSKVLSAQTRKKKVNVCDGLWSSSPSTTTTAGYTWKTVYNVQVDACDIQLLFAQIGVSASGTIKDTYPAAAATFSAAIEYGGVVYPVFFQGQKSITVQPGGIALCDPIGINVTKGSTLAVRFYGSSGTLICNKQVVGGLAGTGGYASGDFTANGAGAVADVATQTTIPGATAILGYPTAAGIPKAVVAIGDSIISYAWDGPGTYRTFTSAKPYLGGGWLQRALQGVGSLLNIGAPTDRASYFADSSNSFLRNSLIEHTRYAVIGYGINDLNSAQTYLQIAQSNVTIALGNLARGVVKNILTTITPYVTTTDRITTLANQTSFTYNANRVLYNNWVRGGAPLDPTSLAPVAVGTSGAILYGHPLHPLAGYIEVADAVESARDSGKWRVDGIRTVSDAAWASGSTFTSATGVFTSADVGKDFVIAGVGAAGVDYYGVIDAVTNSTTFTIPTGVVVPSTVASGQFMAIGTWTREGLHPTAAGHAAIAAAIAAPLAALLN